MTLKFGKLNFGHHLSQFAANGVDVLEVEINYLGLHDAALLFNIKTIKELTEVILQHLSVVTSE